MTSSAYVNRNGVRHVMLKLMEEEMKKRLLIFMSLLMLVFLAGCAGTSNIEETNPEATPEETALNESSAEESEQNAEPLTLTFKVGEAEKSVTVPENPERVVVIGFDLLDVMDSLGLKDKIIGVVDPTGPLFPYYLEGYENVESAGNLFAEDLESIAKLKPDLIIAGARTQKAYDGLNEIAPTVYYGIPGFGSDYKEGLHNNIRSIAQIFNKAEEGETLISNLDAKIEEVAEKVSALESAQALFLVVNGKSIGLFSDDPASRYGFVFKEFGFESLASLDEISQEAATHGDSVSFEFISAKNPDFLIVLDRSAATATEDVAASDTLDNELVRSTNAYKNDHIIYLDGSAWYIGTGGVRSTEIMIDNIMKGIE